MLDEFENTGKIHTVEEIEEHHDSNAASQVKFQQDVNQLEKAFTELGNPFVDNSKDLISLGTNIVMDESNTENLFKVEAAGQQQFKDYWESRIIHHKIPVSNTITKNKFHIFTKPKKDLSKTQKQLKSMKNNVGLFSRLFIACQTRNDDLDTFFAHENQATPPSLSENGSLKLPKKKSEILQCLECDKDVTESPDVDAKIIDGAAIINMLRPSTGKTFQDYANNTFIPFIAHLLKNVKRLDLVWDRYFDDSLKICTRDKRGAGVRRKVSGNGVLPNNWQTFLRCSENKSELFPFLSKLLVSHVQEKLVVATDDENVVSNRDIDMSSLMPCNFEEADERIFVHLKHASSRYSRFLTKTVDSDVVVIAISIFLKVPLRELWIEFGAGKSLKFIPIHEVAASLGPEKSYALPFFHAFSGCDTTSAMSGKGKIQFFDTWCAMDEEITSVFIRLSSVTSPDDIMENEIEAMETFVVHLYSKTCNTTDVNEARKILFCRDNRSIENIPPTKQALIQHILRSPIQSSKWCQCLNAEHDSRDPCQ